jgi:hypothetical protein
MQNLEFRMVFDVFAQYFIACVCLLIVAAKSNYKVVGSESILSGG